MVFSVFCFGWFFFPPYCTFSFRITSAGVCVHKSTAISYSCPSSKKRIAGWLWWKVFFVFWLKQKVFCQKDKKKANNTNDYFTFNCNATIITKSFFSHSALWEPVLEGSFGRIIFLPQNEEYMSYIGLSLLFGLYDDLKILLLDRNCVDDLITVLLCCMDSYVHKAFYFGTYQN